jgi:short-subunit dehydrogenase
VTGFADRYGTHAVIAGASEGIGAAFARQVAARGVTPILVARRPAPLQELAGELGGDAIAADLGTAEGLAATVAATAGREVGLVVANAAYAPSGPFLGRPLDELYRVLDVNCRAVLALAHHYAPAMVARRRGGIIVMSSLAGQQGSPGLATYAASKAFGAVLAEGLWGELRPHGVDVLACVAGAVSTPNLGAAKASRAPGTVTPELVARTALAALGRKPRVVPGAAMRASAQLMSRLLPRRTAINLIGRAARDVTSG